MGHGDLAVSASCELTFWASLTPTAHANFACPCDHCLGLMRPRHPPGAPWQESSDPPVMTLLRHSWDSSSCALWHSCYPPKKAGVVVMYPPLDMPRAPPSRLVEYSSPCGHLEVTSVSPSK
ncbi:hypothetical protein H257_14468 [Aphanomyces astaci]|uniref:Uncharacterized protein n=1 Tax=Aphanomyces astaci TaxID=112090 RepID=W4FT69_APHAT|nr:hypothetical protein H257_14468 [Aphanomyces astaci]ETV69853.1 hypothetical protein H257_14468 [Aphanomyces astaci]|eukprot:XP_009840591.1 hypothetical protein H257_14468 [Aphanomyces astaci]